MSLPIVEKLSGLQESFCSPFIRPRVDSHKKNLFMVFHKSPVFSLFPHVGPMAVWGLGLLLLSGLLDDETQLVETET